MLACDMTETGAGRGDCLACSLATLLGLPRQDVPNFALEADQDRAFREFVEGRGYEALRLTFHSPGALAATFFEAPPRLCILAGNGPRRGPGGRAVGHAVVGRTRGYGVEVVHDPHPSRAGLDEDGPRWVTFLFRRAAGGE